MADETRDRDDSASQVQEGRGPEAEVTGAEEAEMMARLQQEIRNLPVSDHLLYMMQSLSALAVARLGMTPDSESLRDLDQARMAIDGFKALMQIVERTRSPKEMAAQRSALSQLQLAYVEALEPAGAQSADTAGEPATP